MSLKIQLFGKHGCQLCEQARKKIAHFLKKWKLENDVRVVYWDMTTVNGDAEASLYDVNDVPTMVVENDSQELKRWSGPSDEMRSDDMHKILTGVRTQRS